MERSTLLALIKAHRLVRSYHALNQMAERKIDWNGILANLDTMEIIYDRPRTGPDDGWCRCSVQTAQGTILVAIDYAKRPLVAATVMWPEEDPA